MFPCLIFPSSFLPPSPLGLLPFLFFLWGSYPFSSPSPTLCVLLCMVTLSMYALLVVTLALNLMLGFLLLFLLYQKILPLFMFVLLLLPHLLIIYISLLQISLPLLNLLYFPLNLYNFNNYMHPRSHNIVLGILLILRNVVGKMSHSPL